MRKHKAESSTKFHGNRPLSQGASGARAERPDAVRWRGTGWTLLGLATCVALALAVPSGAAAGSAPRSWAGAWGRSLGARSDAMGEVEGRGSVLEGWVEAPAELVSSAVRGRSPGFGAAVTFGAAAEAGATLLIGAPQGLAAGEGGVVLGARRVSERPGWQVGGPRSWWTGPLGSRRRAPGTAPSLGDDEQGRALASALGWVGAGAPGAVLDGQRTGAVSLVPLGPSRPLGVEAQVIYPPAESTGGAFGSALAFLEVNGAARTLAVGAPQEDDPRTGLPLVGAVHLYGLAESTHELAERTGTQGPQRWQLMRTIRPRSATIGMSFGASLAFVGDVLVIGAPGDGSKAPGAGSVSGMARTGEALWRLTSSEAGARFGTRLCALGGAWEPGGAGLAVSAIGRGEVYVYGVGSGTPREEHRLLGRVGDGFGFSLAAMDAHLLVGAPFAGFRGLPLAGVVDRFTPWGGGVCVERLLPPEPTVGGEFGSCLSMVRGRGGACRLAVGEPGSELGRPPGEGLCRPGRVLIYALP